MFSRTFYVILVVAVTAMLAFAVPATAGTISVTHPDNVLTSGSTLNVSTGSNKARLVDDLSDDGFGDAMAFYFGNHDISQRLAITDFTVPEGKYISGIRLYSICNTRIDNDNGCRNLVRVKIRASTSVKSTLTDTDYETLLADVYESPLCTFDTTTVCGTIYAGVWNPYPGTGDAHVYFDIPISAPVGTKSLYLDFGNCYLNSTRDSEGYPPGIRGYGERIYEVQALVADIPEPASIVLLTTGLIGLLCYAWKKRK